MDGGQDAQHGYLLILDASNDSVAGGGPNVLQEVSESGGTYKTIANVPLSSPIDPGTWHAITEVVSGTTVTTSIDGLQVASFDSATFTPDVPAYPAGTFGIRQFTGEEASYSDLTVTSSTGVLYQNKLSDPSAVADFDIPGNNSLPLMVDGAKRDRAVWSGDLAVEGPTLFYSTNTPEYIRGSIELLGSWAGSNGYVSGDMPPQTPVNTDPPGATRNPYSATYSMYFVRDLAEYYQYTADSSFVQKEWPLVANELAWSASQVDANGLLVTDNNTGADWDYYDGAKTGEVTAYNALYYQTLLDGAGLASAAGHPELAGQFTAKAAALRTAINATLFNTATGVYDVSNTVKGVIAQDANVFAIEFGVAPAGEVAAGILAKIKSSLWTPSGTLPYSSGYQNIISPFVSGFELTARLGAGDTDDALQLLSNEWGPMLTPGDLYTGTFWENLNTSGAQGSGQTSMAHGWSTMPTSALSEYVLGIRPVQAGYRTWLVQPHVGSLAWTKGQAPTPHGALAVDWSHNSTGGQFAMKVTAPSGTSGTIAVPTFGKAIDIKANGQKVWSRGVALPGAHRITATPDGDYVDLAVGAGTYNISSAPSPAPRPQSISFGKLTDKVVGDRDFKVSASASSRLPVAFSATGVCSVHSSGVHLTGVAGTCTITASQPGDDQFAPAADVSRSFTVKPVDRRPVAVSDSASTSVDRPVVIIVLANDSDPDRDRLTIAGVGRPRHGTAIALGGKVIYTPKHGYLGSDSFSYSISDGRGGTASATVTVSVSKHA